MTNRSDDDPSVNDNSKRKSFRVDTTLPLYLIFVLLVQASGAIWWASGQTRLTDENTRRIDVIETIQKGVVERLARIDIQTSVNGKQLDRIEDLLQKHIDKHAEENAHGYR